MPGELFNQDFIDKREVNAEVLKQLSLLAIDIAREGREGRKIGTLFTLGDSDAVLALSQPLILDPLYGHADDLKYIGNPNMRETVKELAQLDGAFVVSEEGTVFSACRYLFTSHAQLKLPLGFGARHMAAASITYATKAVAVVVSESGLVRLFDDGELMAEIIPELWMLRSHHSHIRGPTLQHTDEDLTVVNKQD